MRSGILLLDANNNSLLDNNSCHLCNLSLPTSNGSAVTARAACLSRHRVHSFVLLFNADNHPLLDNDPYHLRNLPVPTSNSSSIAAWEA